MSDNANNLIEKIKNNSKLQKIFIVFFALIIIVIFFLSFFSADDNNQTVSQDTNYVTQLESRLSDVLSQVDGAGKVSVVLTVESGMETVLAMKTIKNETENGVEIEETPILVNGKTVVLREDYPKVVGVLIVAEGAKNISVLSRIQQATMSLLDIKANQIEILTMK